MSDAPTRAMITGAGGFVGPHLRRHLTKRGDDVVALDLDTGPDLRDAGGWVEIMARHRPAVVYHLAGWSDVGGSWRDPVTTFAVNALGTVSVLEGARRAEVERVLVVSSADVYGVVDADRLPLREDHPLAPRSPYGASKQAAEAVALQYSRGHGLATVVARPFNHLGPGQSLRFAGPAFAAQVAEAERRGGGEVRHGELETRRDLTDVRDVVRAYRLLARRGEPGEVYNVCSGRAVSIRELLDALLTRARCPVSTRIDPGLLRPVDLPVLCGSFDKLAAATGWTPEIPLEETVTAVLDDARRRISATNPRQG